jgi:hypothetical protein
MRAGSSYPKAIAAAACTFVSGVAWAQDGAVRLAPSTAYASAPAMTGADMANVASAVHRQVKPCADRQIIPHPDASAIVAVVRVRLKRDGSLDGPVEILRNEGVTAASQPYVERVNGAVRAIFEQCTPFRGLPDAFYDIRSGWRTLTFRYRLAN